MFHTYIVNWHGHRFGPAVVFDPSTPVGYQTQEGIRRIGMTWLAGWLRKRGWRNSAKMAEKALTAANSQHTVLPTQTTGSALVIRTPAQMFY